MPGSVSKLTKFPRQRLLDEELLRGHASELDLLARFGDPTGQEEEADEPIFYWDLEFDCGMVMALSFRQISELLTVRLDAYELAHAQRHLGVQVQDLVTIDSMNSIRAEELEKGAPAATAEVWHVVDDGLELVASGLAPRDAACRVARRKAMDEEAFDLLW